MSAREIWLQAHRAARIFRHHKIAGYAAACKLTDEGKLLIGPAIRAVYHPDQAHAGAIESARRVRKLGLSPSKCIALHRQAIVYRRDRRRWETLPKFPASRFTLSRVAFV